MDLTGIRIGNKRLDIPAAIVLAAAIIAVALILVWGPEDVRTRVLGWLIAAAAIVGPFLRQVLTQHPDAIAEASASKPPGQ